jgi:hypothetical protein
MIIKTIAIGNKSEAYIENRLSDDRINLIYSDDNNKGKTVLIQSMMFCLGNSPVFPLGFDAENYYHILEFSINDLDYILCRKKDNFIIQSNNRISEFSNKSEFKRFWSKHIFSLPEIRKEQKMRIVDPELFIEMFFVGQDKNNTSNIVSSWYNKDDFHNMLFAMKDLGHKISNRAQENEIKSKLSELKSARKTLLKSNKILKSKSSSSKYLSQSVDKDTLQSKLSHAESIRKTISELKKDRNRTITRRNDSITTIESLKSLNISIDNGGEVRCKECHSSNIEYVTTNKTYSFDVSTKYIRNQIMNSLTETIHAQDEEIERLTFQIRENQKLLQNALSDEDVNLASLLLYKNDILDIGEIESQLEEMECEINNLEDMLTVKDKEAEELLKKQQELSNNIIKEMNTAYNKISNDNKLEFNSLFTKKNQNVSGSQATEFFASRLFALAKIMNHNCPIIIDSFRTEDLSTDREERLLETLKVLSNQIILTTTLKKQEHNKYDSMSFINSIDYSNHKTYKLLDETHLDEFNKFLKKLYISDNT